MYDNNTWTDYSQGSRRGGDALALWCALHNYWPEGTEKPDRLGALRHLGLLPARCTLTVGPDATLVRWRIFDRDGWTATKHAFCAAFPSARFQAEAKAWAVPQPARGGHEVASGPLGNGRGDHHRVALMVSASAHATTAPACTVIRERTGVLRIRWSADPGTWKVILADFRATLCPLPGVTFDASERAWVVPPAYADRLTRWMGRYFPPGAVVWEGVYNTGPGGADRAGRRPTTPPQLASAYQALYLAPGAPVELVEAARRVLARRYHPDAGGSDDAMKQINAAADLLLSAAHKG